MVTGDEVSLTELVGLFCLHDAALSKMVSENIIAVIRFIDDTPFYRQHRTKPA